MNIRWPQRQTSSGALPALVALHKIWPCTGVSLVAGHTRSSVLTCAGYKFETLSLLSTPWAEATREEIEGREEEVVDNYAQYCSICKTGIGGASMIIGGEVDGGNPPVLLSPSTTSDWI